MRTWHDLGDGYGLIEADVTGTKDGYFTVDVSELPSGTYACSLLGFDHETSLLVNDSGSTYFMFTIL